VLAHVVVFVQGNHRRQLFPVDAHLGGQHRLVSPNLPIVQQDQFRHVAHTGA
jgi:hypothetical protein